MGLESATDINSLNPANPLGTDSKSQGDDHIRMIKTCLKNDAFAASLANGSADKPTPADGDLLLIADSGAGYSRKKLSWANLKATVKAYFDTLYTKIGAITSSGLTMNTGKLLGRTTAGGGAVEEVGLTDGTVQFKNGTIVAAKIPITSTLDANAAGKLLWLADSITLNTGVFSEGDVLTIFNASAGSITITAGSGFGLLQVGTDNWGSRTLAHCGMVTLIFYNAGNNAFISGVGLS